MKVAGDVAGHRHFLTTLSLTIMLPAKQYVIVHEI